MVNKQIKDRGGIPEVFEITSWLYYYLNKNFNSSGINTESIYQWNDMMPGIFLKINFEGERGSGCTHRWNRTCQILIITEVLMGIHFTVLSRFYLKISIRYFFFKIIPYSGQYRNIEWNLSFRYISTSPPVLIVPYTHRQI